MPLSALASQGSARELIPGGAGGRCQALRTPNEWNDTTTLNPDSSGRPRALDSSKRAAGPNGRSQPHFKASSLTGFYRAPGEYLISALIPYVPVTSHPGSKEALRRLACRLKKPRGASGGGRMTREWPRCL